MTARYRDALLRLGLRRRQAEVAALLCDGLSESQIAKRLFITIDTVHYHIKQAYRRLDVHTHVELLRLVHENLEKTT